MCNSSYPLSVQLRIAALDIAARVTAASLPSINLPLVELAKDCERFLLGTHTSESLDELSRQSLQQQMVSKQREQRQALLHVLVGVDDDGVVRVIQPEQTGPMPAMLTMTVAAVIKHRWSHEQAAGVTEFLAPHGLRRYMSDEDIAKWIADGSPTGIVDYAA